VRTLRVHLGLLACALALGAPLARSAGCTVSTSGLNFGTYDVFSPLNDDITATINVDCPSATAYSIWLSSGSNVATPVYGRIPAGQNAWLGSYIDVVTITVNF
jgi:spore coat protein U-like protein